MKIKLGLIYGGKSAEHQVSLQTALAVINALDQTKFDVHPIYIKESGEWVQGPQIEGTVESVENLKLVEGTQSVSLLNTQLVLEDSYENEIDVVFPLLHGPNGEDGTIQGLLEMMNLPYIGNGVLASATGMDKVIMKNIFAQAGLPQANYLAAFRHEWEENRLTLCEQVENKLGYPCFVKPANLGSSVGISKAKDQRSFEQACEEAFKYDRKIVIEEAVVGREIEIGVMGNDQPECSVVGEIAPNTEFYDYQAKYVDGDTDLIIPASVTDEEYELIKTLAIKAFKSIDGSGLVRADFFLKEDGAVLINEVNTMPGFTPYSMFPLLWKHSGVSYPQLIERLVQLALDRYEEKQKNKYTI
ncbi:D-alanine--D-alanine ligase [Bacillus carboniphilus]|uniref:D-alanine--D-alanine ligase n=1 Tax=Bacillus carboniphilus TaxID=86663 RepID=A0ABY9JUM5_9BACI|nr:D-alanine--D-alanine ligase [Bacillus carboniphilus]WLR42137.1 D-alanine--D-alanine ligase [Bacillus carboniphilus]